ncbi:hypothetical protein [Rosistilla oblonga]|uniref:hypothetical protein n=1 Tax=Rosistilla oblonga TaxID=2527990 RepID=UPI003A979F98
MRATLTYASIACLAIHGLAIELHANERPSQNPLVKAWHAVGRTYGVGHGPGYHACPNCNGACNCGRSGGTMHYGTAGHHGTPTTYSYDGTTQSLPAYQGNHGQQTEQMLAAPEPNYVSPAEIGIPSEYNQPQAKPERKFAPKKDVQLYVPETVETPPLEIEELPEVEELRPAESPLFSAPKRDSEDSLPIPKLPSQQRNEPQSPSDIPREVQPPKAKTPQVPAFQPRTSTEPPAATTPPQQTAPTPQPPAKKAPFPGNEDDLLVPPDTHLLDSARMQRQTTGQPTYRSANRSRAVIFEPVR